MNDTSSVGVNDTDKVDTTSIKCSSCGANMVFDPDSQMLFCSHCGTKQSFKSNDLADELDILSGFETNEQWTDKEVSVFNCDNCGAKIVFNNGETSSFCPFCGTSHVVKSSELAGIKPNGILPFTFSLEKGVDFAKAWAKRRLYAPRKFKKNLSAKNVKGVYTPCFTFDSRTFTVYRATLGDTRTRTVGSGKNRRTETYTVWRTVSGSYEDFFDDVLVTAGTKFDQNRLNKVMPFDTNNSSSFDENFMLGFSAYHYDRDVKDCWDDAKNAIDDQIKKRILSRYSYDVLGSFEASTKHMDVTYKYVMLPVYIGNFSHGKKLYNFYVNGTNGRVSGKSPVSLVKVLLTVLLSVALIGLIGLLIYSS